MLLADVVATSSTVAATRSRKAKIAALSDLLRRSAPTEVAAVVGFLTGVPRQGRIGVGWASVGRTEGGEAAEPTVTVAELDELISRLSTLVGPGSVAARTAALGAVLVRATAEEATFIRLLFTGQLRQGALEGIMADAVATAAGLPAAAVRRALMLSGDLGEVATLALAEGAAALAALGLQLGRPLRPMLASPAADLDDALAGGGLVSVEAKLDGARIQVHRAGSDVAIFTRNLNDVTSRLPEVVAGVVALPGGDLVLDGEIIGLTEEAAESAGPRLFQETMSRFGTHTAAAEVLPLSPFWFDVLHAGDDTLLDEPLAHRRAVLEGIVGGAAVPAVSTEDPEIARAFLDRSLAAGHEGIMVKDASSPYIAGRRGRTWRKVKPVRMVDLVVLGAEWGHGRRRGWLSNLHLGARDPAEPGRFVMVGKTFKGLTDELLAWQTAALLARQRETEGITVFVRPELVVEIALDGVQVSTRYPGGVALRFARVRRYRPDKSPEEADTIDTVRALLNPAPPATAVGTATTVTG